MRPPAQPEAAMIVTSRSEHPGRAAPIRLSLGKHEIVADMGPEDGGQDEGPRPHDLFDASLAACKSLTATWYANRNGIPLTGVDVRVERDASRERQGEYGLKVKVEFHGPMTVEQRQKLRSVVARCPLHKLMTQVKISIEDLP
jgi:putative redox protein